VTLVDITYCLEHRVKQAIGTKRSHYEPLRRALLAQGHILPEVVVIVAHAWGSIPASTLDTLRNHLGLNRAPAERTLRKTHLAACEHLRRMIHTRRAIETLTMGPQGIVTKPFQRDKSAEDAHLTETHRPIRADPGDPLDERFRTQLGVLAFYLAFSISFYFPHHFLSQLIFSHTSISLLTYLNTHPLAVTRQNRLAHGARMGPSSHLVFSQILDYRRPSGQ